MSKQILENEKQDKKLLFAKNIEKGRIAELIAREDYENHGFSLTTTGIGSDFMAEKQLSGSTKPYREFVEVKAGNSPLTKKQKVTKRQMKKEGIVFSKYVVSNSFIENYLQENTIPEVTKHELRELIPESWEQDNKYRIHTPGICPHCKLTVNTLDSILSKFGLRKMQDDTIRNQSWCRKCRSLSNKFSGGYSHC